MTGNVFQTTDTISPERLNWISNILKYYCTKLYPESLHHVPKIPTPLFYLFITGDALYSLLDRRCFHQWEILLSLPPVLCICSQKELRLRGLSIEPLRMKYPDQIITVPVRSESSPDPYWDKFLEITAKDSDAIGVLHIDSPYMYRNSQYTIDLLNTAVSREVSPELYAYLDGIHVTHRDQRPTDFESVSNSLEMLFAKARNIGLEPLMFACSRCATSRGYSTFRNPKGKIISACTIAPVKIRNLDQFISRFRKEHPIVSSSSFAVQITKERRYPRIKPQKPVDPPPLVVLVTQSPYGTETTFGAISFAIACAHHGIPTSVIFIEDGIYTVAGNHVWGDREKGFNMQEIVEATADMNNLEYYSYIPSFQQRGLVSTYAMKHVQPLDAQELALVLFHSPATVESRFQRVIFF
ncbi:MAG TPA: DsrE family protein [Methanoregulaceae archaeon]|nr:DsrE family protein [Methanoregulaceae archaeon]